MPAAILVSGLRKHYGRVEALRGLSFEVQAGEIFALLGRNGAGKTSTLECLLGLRQPDGGTIQINGLDGILDRAQIKQRIGAALQSTTLQDDITPREALKLFGSFYARRCDIPRTLERFTLTGKGDVRFASLSEGQKQRLGLALAVVHEPDILFLDEPTAGLDPQARRDLHQTILAMRAEGRTILLTTHNIEEAAQLCDQVAIMDGGQIAAIGPPQELTARAKANPKVIVKTARPLTDEDLTSLSKLFAVNVRHDSMEIVAFNVSETIGLLVRFLQASGHELTSLKVEQPSLEDAFLELTEHPLPPAANKP